MLLTSTCFQQDIVGRQEHQFFKLNKTRTGVLTRDDIIKFNAKTSKLMGVQYRQRSFHDAKEFTEQRLRMATSFSFRERGSSKSAHRVAPSRRSTDEFGTALVIAAADEAKIADSGQTRFTRVGSQEYDGVDDLELPSFAQPPCYQQAANNDQSDVCEA
jgi:hypothetical protein